MQGSQYVLSRNWKQSFEGVGIIGQQKLLFRSTLSKLGLTLPQLSDMLQGQTPISVSDLSIIFPANRRVDTLVDNLLWWRSDHPRSMCDAHRSEAQTQADTPTPRVPRSQRTRYPLRNL